MLDSDRLEKIRKVLKEFLNLDKVVDIVELKGGHINSTYLVTMPEAKYILQQINHYVFTSPYGMMHNIDEVTDYIRRQLIFEGYDPDKHILYAIKTIYGQLLCIRDDEYWRCMKYIDNSTAYNRIETPELMYEVGYAIGNFQRLLEGFHTRVLDDTIKHFHDTPYRFDTFKNAVKIDRMHRVKNCQEEIDFILNNSDDFDIVVRSIEEKTIPRRVTHNDTKPSNILIDNNTKKALCLIDLDTVMRGSIVYDYGDALRIGCSTAEEDDNNLDNVQIDYELFTAFNKGFLKEVRGVIVPNEVSLLYYGFFLMTMEVGMRFLTDYLDGDKYFKVSYREHNLVRAKNQLKMAKVILENEAKLKGIIKNCLIELEYEEIYLNI